MLSSFKTSAKKALSPKSLKAYRKLQQTIHLLSMATRQAVLAKWAGHLPMELPRDRKSVV